jgi:D-threonate/D-erythronate kinase
MTTLPLVGLIADDFTGAMDSGAQFSRSSLGVYFRFAGQSTGDVEIINTASREIHQAHAITRTRNVCRLLTGRQLFKKIDSTLRGHVAAEIEAILSVSPYRKAVICSAAPLQGRTIRNGVLYVDNLPLEQTPFKDDPVYPARSSLVSELIGRSTSHLSIEQVRSSPEKLAQAIHKSKRTLITADAETSDDLLTLARAILLTHSLPCGAFGLAKAYLEALDVPPLPRPAFRPKGRVLVLAGSANQITRNQIRILETRPDAYVLKLDCAPDPASLKQSLSMLPSSKRIFVLCADQERTVHSPEWLRFGRTLSEAAFELLDEFQPEMVLVIGGETVTYFCDLLQTESIEIIGEATPGIPFGCIHGGRLDQRLLITKAGGFGQANTLTDILCFEEAR